LASIGNLSTVDSLFLSGKSDTLGLNPRSMSVKKFIADIGVGKQVLTEQQLKVKLNSKSIKGKTKKAKRELVGQLFNSNDLFSKIKNLL